MIPVTSRHSQSIAVFGLGTSGLATALALSAGGAIVSAWDDNPDRRAEASNKNIVLTDPTMMDWSTQDALILSPGVPLMHPAPHPAITGAQAAGKQVIGDVELLFENVAKARLIGITGTNGKSTTSSLIHHVLRSANVPVQIGGNFGPPALDLEPIRTDDTLVLELSSYQLDLIETAAFDVAVFLNLAPDHLDRHRDMEGYASAKKRIFQNHRKSKQTAVIGVDDIHGVTAAAELSERAAWTTIEVSAERVLPKGVYVTEGILTDQDGYRYDISKISTLHGPHNWQNAAAAWAIARTLGIAPDVIATAFKNFPGLPHRLETVATLDGIRFVNDSKATNSEAASKALSSYDQIYWIAGGVAKDGNLTPSLADLARVRKAYLIGDSAADLGEELAKYGVSVSESGDLATALNEARADATTDKLKGSVILFSPACASFDQYPNFEKRGDHFRELVMSLTAEERV
ncbi:MAG: UDP-N-acetylmuramoylalanine--D-glutamate ligase [Alphaproteobacteria bacterium MarineAlpha11_Bin1]|nr:MAG: UDP-N-acetylmuramoylalanine--D-glutamate ligase [Alphaproteobacteria bacterium MarineAlpha11_Bin1]|tara:strand:+ start:6994 stop:8376 length:1383 start_codon:yes stop_codon:yes gene_type:complete